MSVLMIDVGGSHVKVMSAPDQKPRRFRSGKTLTGQQMIKGVLDLLGGWTFDRISLGYPGLIRNGHPSRDPLNLGPGWIDLDFSKAFGVPVRFINDAAMQALGNYDSGRLLFLGLGTSTGTSLIVDDIVLALEIGLLKLSKRARLMDRLSKKGLEKFGRRRWTRDVREAVALLQDVFNPDITILGGGNAELVEPLPEHCRRVDNSSAYRGALRLWEDADLFARPCHTTWRIERPPAD